MAKYECAAIIRADIGAEPIQSMITYLKTLLEKNSATITKTDIWGTRRLAYEINKQREGHYVIYEFTMTPDGAAVQEMLRLIRTQENILRAIFVNIPKLADKAKALNERRAKAMAEKAKNRVIEEEAQAKRQAAAMETAAEAAAAAAAGNTPAEAPQEQTVAAQTNAAEVTERELS